MGEADTYVAGALGAIFGKNIQFVLFSALIASMFFILPVFSIISIKTTIKNLYFRSTIYSFHSDF